MRIAILLVAWNERENASCVLESLEAQSFRDFETILVDDGSHDGTADMVRERFPWVKLIALPAHTGFTHTNNLAAAAAEAPLLFVLNTDTQLPEDCLAHLDKAADTYGRYQIFSPQMIRFDKRDTVDCKGMTWQPSLTARIIDQGAAVDDGEQSAEVFGATGGAMLLRREVYEAIGLFDDALYFNNEDVDFCLRAYAAGFRTLYLPWVRVFHRRSPNQKKMPDKVHHLIQRNMEAAAYKNVPLPVWLTHGPVHAAYNLFQVLKHRHEGRAMLTLKAKRDAIALARTLTRKPMDTADMLSIIGRNRLD